jgi:DNA end-binding protein Ku
MPSATPGGMARAIWNGLVGFGLVQIPMGLYSAEAPNELDLTLLDKRDFSPVGYERVNKKTGKEVKWDDIVKGYEHKPGKFVVLTDQDFEEANVEATRQMDIVAFVDFSEIDPRYFDRPYYLAPQKAGKKAYVLLRETLRKTGKAGIGKVVIRTRQHLAAVVPHEKALILMVLRFADELRDESELDLPDGNLKKLGVTPKEAAMAEKLVLDMAESFKPDKYEDDYRRDLMKLIHRKAKAGEVNTVPEKVAKKRRTEGGAKVIDLAALLAQSVEGGKRAARGKSKGAPRKRTRAEPHHQQRKSA